MFTAQVDAKRLTKLLKKFEKAGGDLSPMTRVIAEQLVADVNDEFDSEGRGRWPKLAASTLAKRRKGGAGAKILQDTGRFAASVSPYSGVDYAQAATDVEYAVYHVSEAARSVIPLRNPFDVPDAAIERAAETLLVLLDQAMSQMGSEA